MAGTSSMVGNIIQDVKSFMDTELTLVNATSQLKLDVDNVVNNISKLFFPTSSYEYDNVTSSPSPEVWTPRHILILVGIILSALIALLLGMVVIAGILFSRKKITGQDVLVVNHLMINLITSLWAIPVGLTIQYIYGNVWQFSATICHIWGFSRGLLLKASGVSLTLLSLHQLICIIAEIIQTSNLTISFRNHFDRRIFYIMWKCSLVVAVWTLAFAAETSFFELEPRILKDNCALVDPDEDGGIDRFLLIEEIVTFWIPTTVSAYVCLYVGVFFAIFPQRFKQIMAASLKNPSTNGGDNNHISWISFATEENASDSAPLMDEMIGNSWENAQVTIKFEEDQLQGGNDEKEFSFETLIVWLGLIATHFLLVVPLHVMLLVAKEREFETVEEFSLWYAIVVGFSSVKFFFADFVVLLAMPRIRKRIGDLFRRMRS